MYKVYSITSSVELDSGSDSPQIDTVNELGGNDGLGIDNYWNLSHYGSYTTKESMLSEKRGKNFTLISGFSKGAISDSSDLKYYTRIRIHQPFFESDDIVEVKQLFDYNQYNYTYDTSETSCMFIGNSTQQSDRKIDFKRNQRNGKITILDNNNNTYEINPETRQRSVTSNMSSEMNIITINVPYTQTDKTMSYCRSTDHSVLSENGSFAPSSQQTTDYVWILYQASMSSAVGSRMRHHNPISSVTIYSKDHKLKHKYVPFVFDANGSQTWCGYIDLCTGRCDLVATTDRQLIGDPIKEDQNYINSTSISDSKLLYTDAPNIDFVNALDCKLNLKDSAAGSISFKLPPTHDAYEHIKMRRSYIAVVEDSNEKTSEDLYHLDNRYNKLDYVFSEGICPTSVLPAMDINQDYLEIDFEVGDTVEAVGDTNATTVKGNDAQLLSFSQTNSYNDSVDSSYYHIDFGMSNDYNCYINADLYEIYRYYRPLCIKRSASGQDSYIPIHSNVEDIDFDIDDSSIQYSKSKYSAISTNIIHTLKIRNSEYYLDGVSKELYLDGPIDNRNSSVTDRLLYPYIGGRLGTLGKYGRTKVYEVRQQRNGVWHTFIPVYDKETYISGLYDVEDRVFYPSVSGVPWFAGPVSSITTNQKMIKPMWVGRVVSKTTDFNKNVTYKATGLLDLFADHVIKPVYPNNYEVR